MTQVAIAIAKRQVLYERTNERTAQANIQFGGIKPRVL